MVDTTKIRKGLLNAAKQLSKIANKIRSTRRVNKEAGEQAETIHQINRRLFPNDFKVLELTTHQEVDSELAHIIDGTVGFDIEFVNRKPTKEEAIIYTHFGKSSPYRKAALLGWQVVEKDSHPDFPVAWDHISICTIQIATTNKAWIINLTKIRAYPYELRRLITSPNIKKVGVGLISDIQRIWADLRDDALNMIDAGMMAKLWLAEKYGDTGYSNLSLEISTAEVLGYRVNKDLQTSDWKSDLSKEQL
ncbi:ribonuclease H-like domain-containing protein [Mycena epipterygia]|nr:ribonuclease H-like domain-containing protein [Mycena epipterygia]